MKKTEYEKQILEIKELNGNFVTVFQKNRIKQKKRCKVA